MDCITGPDLMKPEENDLFYFESDHLALKGNKDYCEVLKTLVILSAIREKAIKDYGKVVEVRKQCLEDPIGTFEKIQTGEDLGVPPSLELPKLPHINFEKFDVKVYESDLKAIYSEGSEKVDETKINEKINTKKEGAWTLEEQKRLEELLVIYPPEPIEIKRFQKIAAALGNRSVQQVTSRVQKYFIKLYKAGLPIPGRIPKSIDKYKRTNLHQRIRNQRYNNPNFWKPSTFFPDLYVPVTMDEQENVPGPSVNPSSPVIASTSSSQNYLLPTDYHQSVDKLQPKNEIERQLQLLKRVKAEKLKEQESDSVGLFRHFGFRCDYCDSDPITGSRWHCMTCNDSVDFCTDCLLSQMYSSEPHPLSHIIGVFRGNGENPSLEGSDSDTQTEVSGPYKNYESDSNWSGDFDGGNNMEDFIQENVNSEVMEQDNS